MTGMVPVNGDRTEHEKEDAMRSDQTTASGGLTLVTDKWGRPMDRRSADDLSRLLHHGEPTGTRQQPAERVG